MSAAPRLVALVGPTGVGKTALALALAERLPAEIVSADSRLLYRGMDIGTAKPTPDERARVPHHLIDLAEPDEPWSLALYQEAAHQAIADIDARGRLPLLVGGTGQYVAAILDGWSPPALAADPVLRAALEDEARREGGAALHARLRALDPDSAARIDPRNLRRVIRALEVIQCTGAPASRQRARGPAPYRDLRLGLNLPRAQLYARVDARIEAMLAAGWVEEVRRLLAHGRSPDLPSMSAIGYRELAAHVQGEMDLEEAVRRIRRASRALVRRQANWFKAGDARILWFEAREDVVTEVEECVRSWLADAAG